jgi:hypothetical protein
MNPSPDSEKSDIKEVQRTFMKGFNAEHTEMWSDFLDRFGKSEGRICYYPSAGSDFRRRLGSHDTRAVAT